MGAFGYKDFDNDEALGFADKIFKPLIKFLLKKKLSHSEYDEFRAAVGLLFNNWKVIKYSIDDNEYDLISLKLKQILNDNQYVHNWDQPVKIRAEIRKQLNRLDRLRELDL